MCGNKCSTFPNLYINPASTDLDAPDYTILSGFFSQPDYRGALKASTDTWLKNTWVVFCTWTNVQLRHSFSAGHTFLVLSNISVAEMSKAYISRVKLLIAMLLKYEYWLGKLPPINKVDGYLNSINSEIRNLAGEIQKGHFNKTNVDDRRKSIVDFCITRFKLS